MSTIPINPTSIKKYLDNCIRYWRNKSKNSKIKVEKIIAESNIDAFQSVRISLFGKLLPKPKPKPDSRLISYIEKGCIPKWFAVVMCIILAILLLLFIISIFIRNI